MSHRLSILDRLAVLTLGALFIVAQFGALPLTFVSGQARLIPTWSTCGEALCLCAPEPFCPLCDGAPTCTKRDFSGADKPDTKLTHVETIVAIPLEQSRAVIILDDDASRPLTSATMSAPTRPLRVPSPPPRA